MENLRSHLALVALLAGGGTEAGASVEVEVDVDARVQPVSGAGDDLQACDVAPVLLAGEEVLERRENRRLGVFFAGETGTETGRAVAGAGDSSST